MARHRLRLAGGPRLKHRILAGAPRARPNWLRDNQLPPPGTVAITTARPSAPWPRSRRAAHASARAAAPDAALHANSARHSGAKARIRGRSTDPSNPLGAVRGARARSLPVRRPRPGTVQPEFDDDRFAGQCRLIADDQHAKVGEIDCSPSKEAEIPFADDVALDADGAPNGAPLVGLDECAHEPLQARMVCRGCGAGQLLGCARHGSHQR